MKKEEILSKIKVGGPIYLLDEDCKLHVRPIRSINEDSVSFTFDAKYAPVDHAEFNYEKAHVQKSYNQRKTVKYFFSQEDAATAKREEAVTMLNKMKSNLEKYLQSLIDFRKENFEILNSTNTDEWIENFKRKGDWL